MKKCSYCGKEYPDDADICAFDQNPLDAVTPPLPSLPPASSFYKWVATFSLLAPVIVILIYLSLFLYFRANGRVWPALFVAVGLLVMLLLVSGLVLGVVTLVAVKSHERKGVFGRALVGTCLNGLFLVLLIVVPLWLSIGFRNKFPGTPQARLARASNKLAVAGTGENRFYALDDAAKDSFNAGRIEDARKYATELLALAPSHPGNWNYGNAIQDGNLVLGRIALSEGQVEEAGRCLLEAGRSPGSPQMDSFGPNMSLAKDLLERGEKDTVLQYFELCRKFWKMDNGKLDLWSREVKAGQIPDFGANLVY
ncbi:MAG: tetratricopeptide repeat protein [Limisphaerales bacterium]